MNKKFKDNLNVLVYGDVDKMENKMNNHFLDRLSHVSDKMTQEPKTIGELNDYVRDGKYTHVLVPDENFHKLNGSLEKCVVPVVEFLQDHWIPWAIDKKRDYLEKNGIEDTIVFSERFQEEYNGVTHFHTVLAGFDTSTFFDQGKERDIDVLISGAIHPDKSWIYPVRTWLSEILPEIGIKEGLNVEILNHPGYNLENGSGKKTRDYANVINRAKISTGGSSHWRLPLQKFYEIPACGSILLSDLPLEDKEFFEERILEVDSNEINSKKSEDLVRRKVMNVLENYDVAKRKLQPFKTEKDKFDRSYSGKALEMRTILETIKS